jgi:Helicase conserved C-terminal domain
LSELLLIAGSLREMSEAELKAVLRPLGSSAASLGDLFDLARAMVGRRELERRIRLMDKDSIAILKSGGTNSALQDNFLASSDSAFESAVELARELQPIGLKPVKHELASSELANYETQLAITEILFACERHWLEAVKAGLRAAEAKDLAAVLKMDLAQLQLRFQLARRAGLVDVVDNRYVSTIKGLQWLDADPAQRWYTLAQQAWDLPQLALSTESIAGQLSEQYPLFDQNDLELLRYGHILGLLSDLAPTPLFQAASLDLANAGQLVWDQLPKPVSRIIIQGDLSIIAPGPLAADVHKQIDLLAQSEDLGLACRFRLSLNSILHAMEMGMSAAEIEKILLSLSASELPQPVSYLLTQAKKKFGELTVRSLEGQSVVESGDPILLTQILNESGLTALMFRADGERLVSRLNQSLIYFNLRDAGYPVIQLDEAGKVIAPRLSQVFVEPEVVDVFALQAKALLSAEAKAPSPDDHLRQLQFALKNKLKVGVRVDMPEGIVEIEMTPLGIAGGRFRGRDVVKEAERTLPLSRIQAVWLS